MSTPAPAETGCRESSPELSLTVTVIQPLWVEMPHKCSMISGPPGDIGEYRGISDLMPLSRREQYRQRLCPKPTALGALLCSIKARGQSFTYKMLTVVVIMLAPLWFTLSQHSFKYFFYPHLSLEVSLVSEIIQLFPTINTVQLQKFRIPFFNQRMLLYQSI